MGNVTENYPNDNGPIVTLIGEHRHETSTSGAIVTAINTMSSKHRLFVQVIPISMEVQPYEDQLFIIILEMSM